MLRTAYGVLKLLPATVRELTPGELLDLIAARVWVQRQRNPETRTPLTPAAHAANVAKLQAHLAAKARPEPGV